MPASGEHHPAFEEYCECIFELHEDDVEVIQARIAERLQVSRPAVSEMMKRLEAEGPQQLPGITDTIVPRRLGPKRASHIRKLFNLTKKDDVRQYVVRRTVVSKKDPAKKKSKVFFLSYFIILDIYFFFFFFQ